MAQLFHYSINIITHSLLIVRASKLLNSLKEEEFLRLKAGRQFPDVQPGDSVLIEKLPHISATEPDIVKGLVISKTNRASDTALRILNVRYYLTYTIYPRYTSGKTNFFFFGCIRSNTELLFSVDWLCTVHLSKV